MLTDDFLKEDLPSLAVQLRDERAQAAAVSVYSQYGNAAPLPAFSNRNIAIGRLLNGGDDESVFAHQVARPTTVHAFVTNQRADDRSGAMLLGNISGVSKAQIVSQAVVQLQNRLAGFQLEASRPPTILPTIIIDGAKSREPGSWSYEIEDRHGADEYTWDEDQKTVLPGSDGLPEMRLELSTATLMSLSRLLQEGSVRIPFEVSSANDDEADQFRQSLEQLLGTAHVVFLRQQAQDGGTSDVAGEQSADAAGIQISRAVAARIVAVSRRGNEAAIVLQPCVMNVPEAVMSADASVPENSYLWTLQLVN